MVHLKIVMLSTMTVKHQTFKAKILGHIQIQFIQCESIFNYDRETMEQNK